MKRKVVVVRVLFLILVSIRLCCATAKTDVNSQLDELENLSTTDFQAVQAQLAELLRDDALTIDQWARVRLLSAHQLLVTGDASAGLPLLRAVFQRSEVSAKYRLRAYTHTAHIESQNDNHERAFESIYKGLKLLQQVDDPSFIFGTLHSAASIHFDIGAYSESLEYGNRALELAVNQMGVRQECFALQVIVASIVRLDLKDAEPSMTRAIATCEQASEPIPLRNILIFFSDWLISHTRYGDAIESLNKASDIGQKNTIIQDVVHVHTLLGRAYLRTGDLARAGENARKALTLIESSNVAELTKRTKDAHDVLAEVAEIENDFATALEHQRAAVAAEEQWRNDSRTRLNAMLAARYQAADQAYQIEQANRLLELERQIARSRENLLYTIGIAAFAVLVLVFIWLQKVRAQKQAFQALSERDSLTGIFNRRRILAGAKACFDESVVEGWAMSVVLLDLDEFKSINDRFGHQTGDWALINVCTALKANLRERDQFGRTGGEEFLLLLPNTKAGKAAEIAEECRKAIAALDCTPSGASFTITGSFGVAEIGWQDDAAFGFGRLS